MYNDFWEYTPDIPSGINELGVWSLEFGIFIVFLLLRLRLALLLLLRLRHDWQIHANSLRVNYSRRPNC
jgi:hypothetical protein